MSAEIVKHEVDGYDGFEDRVANANGQETEAARGLFKATSLPLPTKALGSSRTTRRCRSRDTS